MTFRNRMSGAILEFVALLFFVGVAVGDADARDYATQKQIVAYGPERHVMRLVSFEPWVVEGDTLVLVASYIYEDVTSGRPADYWEIYNEAGQLLAVTWFDNHSLRQTAVDRGIIEEKNELEGVFVLMVDGEPI